MKFKMWVRQFFKRISVKFNRWERQHSIFQTKEDVTDYENTCMSICRNLIKNSKSKFAIAPLSEKKYIINEDLGIFVVIQDFKIEITNHVYHYEVKLGKRNTERIHNMFNKKSDKIRLEYEAKIKSQVSFSLEEILKKVSKN
jgi:hypothetical protein